MIKNKLLEVIKNNPDLPIIVCSYNGDANYDYDSTVYFDLSVYVEELDKLLVIIKDHIAHDYDYYYGEPSYDKINNYDISIGSKHGK